MKLLYIANVRIPTYRAHGVQITKMCEQFALCGADVRLIVPDKRHTIGGTDDLFDYYHLKRNFHLLRLKCLDLLGMTTACGALFYWLDVLSFLFALSVAGRVRPDAVLYTRDPLLLLPFSKKQNLLCVEVHDIPARNIFFGRLLRRAHVVVTLTHLLKNDLIAMGIHTERIIVAPDAVALNEFQNPESRTLARARLGLPQEAKIALYVGRLDGWKGVDTLCEAASLLPSDIETVVIGGDTEESKALASKYFRVHFLEPHPYSELADNQSVADLLVLPNSGKSDISAKYTSPLKLFTYMASGKPIVASDLPSLREVLSEKNAFLVKPDDPEALAEGIRYALEHPEEAARRAAQALEDVKRYTWESRAKHILDFVNEK